MSSHWHNHSTSAKSGSPLWLRDGTVHDHMRSSRTTGTTSFATEGSFVDPSLHQTAAKTEKTVAKIMRTLMRETVRVHLNTLINRRKQPYRTITVHLSHTEHAQDEWSKGSKFMMFRMSHIACSYCLWFDTRCLWHLWCGTLHVFDVYSGFHVGTRAPVSLSFV